MKKFILLFSLSVIFTFQIQSQSWPNPCQALENALCGLDSLDGYELDMIPGEFYFQPMEACSGTWHNTSWFAFVAGATNITIQITPSGCSGSSTGDEGLQAGVYQLNTGNCDPNMQPFEWAAMLETVDPIGTTLQCNCSPTVPVQLTSPNFEVGGTYAVFIDGCNGSGCHIVIDTLNGGGAPVVDQVPNDLSFDVELFESDTLCYGATNVLLDVPDAFGAFGYVWEINGVIDTTYDSEFVAPGPIFSSFQVCVTAFNLCAFSTPVCMDVYVDFPKTFLEFEVICEGDPFTWDVPVSNTMSDQYTATRYSPLYSCEYTVVLDLTVINENDENPTVIDTAICYGTSFDLPPHSWSDPIVPAEEFIIPAEEFMGLQCDSFISLQLDVLNVLNHNMYEAWCENGIFAAYASIEIQPFDANVIYYWYDDDQTLISNDETLYTTAGGLYHLEIELEKYGVVCEFYVDQVYIDEDALLPDQGDIDGPETVCAINLYNYTATGVNDNPVFNWFVPNGAVIVSGSGSPSITVDFANATSGNLYLITSNDCSDAYSDTLYIQITPLPVADAGPDDEACGDSYDLQAVSASGGIWTQVSGPGTSIFSNIVSPTSNVNVSDYGSYQFIWTEGSADCSDIDTVNVVFQHPLEQVSITDHTCIGGDVEYTVTFEVNFGTPPYTIVTGGGNFDTNGTTYTSGTFPNSTPYTVVITDSENCDSLVVTGTVNCDCETDPGAMDILTTIDICEDDQAVGTFSGGEVSDGNDVGEFIFYSNNANPLASIISTNSVPEFFFISASMTYDQTYYISHVFGDDDGSGSPDYNDGCLGVTQGQPVIFRKNPVPDAGPDDSVCGLFYEFQATADAGNGIWGTINAPGSVVFDFGSSPSSGVSVSQPGTYIFRWSEDNFGCTGNDSLSIVFHGSPMVDTIGLGPDCDDAGETFTISFNIQGGDPGSYEVFGDGTLSGNSFTSDPIDIDTDFSFLVFDGFACDTFEVSGNMSCECLSAVGTMESATQTICGNGEISAVYDNTNEFPDGNDALVFYLHDAAGNTLGTISDFGPNPAFSFQSGMVYGQTYYISAIVGNSDGAGGINFSDNCASIAPGTSVIWYNFPDANADAPLDQLSCTQTELPIFGATSTSPHGSLSYLWFTNSGSIISDTDLDTVLVNADGMYYLQVTDQTSGCSDIDSFMINKAADVPDAIASVSGILTCVNLSVDLSGVGSSEGSNFDYNWTTTDGNIISGESTLAPVVNLPGTYFIQVTNIDNGCNNSASVIVQLDTVPPNAEIENAPMLDCDTEEIVIDASASSTGLNFTYLWTTSDGNILNGGTSLTPTIDEAGVYELLITNTDNGCTQINTITIDENDNVIAGFMVDSQDPSCFGYNDAQIDVVSIFGGEEPFQFSINGSAWSDDSEFDQLPEGTYLVNVQDQNGCDYDTTIMLTAPDLLTLDLGGDITATFGEIVEITAQTNLPFDQIDTIIWEGVNIEDLCGNVCESLTLLPINGQYLTATVISVNGCTVSEQIFFQIKTDRQVFIPNVFTPNEDLLNTMFIPVDKKEIKIIQEMRIFSRWGEEIFTDFNIEANQDNGWDGTFKGQEMPQGVYLYYFKIEYVDGKILPFVGDVTLLR